jgi:hypothetical protein
MVIRFLINYILRWSTRYDDHMLNVNNRGKTTESKTMNEKEQIKKVLNIVFYPYWSVIYLLEMRFLIYGCWIRILLKTLFIKSITHFSSIVYYESFNRWTFVLEYCLFVCLFHFTPFSNSISVLYAGSFLTIVPEELHQY